MKRIIILLLTILFIPMIVNAEECDTSKVYIDSISVDKTNNVEELDKSSVEDKTINLDLAMFNVGDNIKYKITIKNDSNEDYEFDKDSINISSDYVDYTIESTDNTTLVKANSSKTIFLKVNYANQVSANVYENGSYSDNMTMKVNLKTEDNLSNPNTGVKYFIIISIILSLCIILFVIKKKKLMKIMIIIGILIIPFAVKALCKCEIQLKSKVTFVQPIFTGTITRSSGTNLRIGDSIDFRKIRCRNTCSYIDENEFTNKKFYIKHEIVDNVITGSYVCNNNLCIKGGPNIDFEENKQAFFTLHSEQLCDITDDRVYNGGSHDYIERSGNSRLGNYCGECVVNSDGSSVCHNLDLTMC